MGCVIAMAGKGGTGKTTIAALIIRLVREKKLGSVLGIDADPNSNLAEALGLMPKETIGRILDEVAAHPEKIPAGMPKDRFIEYRVQEAVLEGDGFDVLTMGKPEGPGCYCYVNNVLRGIMAALVKDYDYVIIDNEAGLEHLSRRTARSADSLVMVSDATKAGLKASRRINELTGELDIKIKKKFLLVNRYGGNMKEAAIQGVDYLGNIPSDAGIEKISANGGSVMELDNDAASITALRKIGDKIWHCS